MDKLSKSDPEFYTKLQALRKNRVGGKAFKNKELAKDAQKKSVQSRIANKKARQGL